jgi:hypothetical protein
MRTVRLCANPRKTVDLLLERRSRRGRLIGEHLARDHFHPPG